MDPGSENAMLIALRAKKEEQRKARKEPPPSPDAGYERLWRDLIKLMIESALAQLSPAERALITAYQRGDEGFKALAKARGCRALKLQRQFPVVLLKLREILRGEF